MLTKKNMSLLTCLNFRWCDLSWYTCSLFLFYSLFWFSNDLSLITLRCYAQLNWCLSALSFSLLYFTCVVVGRHDMNPLFIHVVLFHFLFISSSVDGSWSWNLENN